MPFNLPKSFPLPYRITPFLSLYVFSLLLVYCPELPTPFFSSLFLIYSVRLVGMPWLSLFISGNDGPIPSCLSGCLGRRGGSGIGTDSHLQEPTWQRYHLWQHQEAETLFCQVITHPTKLRLIRCVIHFRCCEWHDPVMFIGLKPGLKKCLDQRHESDGERARCYIPRSGLEAQKAWVPVPYSVSRLESKAQWPWGIPIQ